MLVREYLSLPECAAQSANINAASNTSSPGRQFSDLPTMLEVAEPTTDNVGKLGHPMHGNFSEYGQDKEDWAFPTVLPWSDPMDAEDDSDQQPTKRQLEMSPARRSHAATSGRGTSDSA
jgi:hypothetical protein